MAFASMFINTLPFATASTHTLVEEPATEAAFVGRKTCAQCHQQQDKLWSGSHHDLAMQVADQKSVLGDFNNARFTYAGVTSMFYERDGKFMVRTIMSPRLMSTSSSVVITIESEADAFSMLAPYVSIDLTRVLWPEGSITISSPGSMEPDATRPANPRKF